MATRLRAQLRSCAAATCALVVAGLVVLFVFPASRGVWALLLAASASVAALWYKSAQRAISELKSLVDERARLEAELTRVDEERARAQKALASAQERLLHAHKLEAVGRLSGGIAHDFNNSLTVILSYAELLKTRLRSDPALTDLADQIIHAAEQGGELTKQLLTFSRRQVAKPRVVDVREVLRATERAVARLVPRSVQVQKRQSRDELYVNIDPTQLQHALLNLALNARDAMPDGGELLLEAEAVEVSRDDGLPLVPGSYVVLRVRDTGLGMAPETLARIFEPFFTTKEPGLGTGLGLSNVRETVTAAGGHVAVQSELGRGSSFALYFPRADPRVSGVNERFSVLGQKETTLLVVDDEPQVREVIQTMLAESGYRTVPAGSAQEALELLTKVPVDLLCTDLVMPDSSGAALIEDVRRRFPGLPVVVCSAYGNDDNLGPRMTRGDVQLLTKPFTRKDLLTAVERALSTRAVKNDQSAS